jgi:coenzyme F420-reducing hydrogenase delta subunit
MLYDKLTVMKGFLQLETERKSVDYSLILLHELDEIENLLNSFYDRMKELDDAALEDDDE